jgi:dethiobiotin synthetase
MVSSNDLNLMTDDLRLETFLLVGTDTGVGKTVFSGLFARYLMDNGVGVQAVKPFCAGGKADIEFLQAARDGLAQEEVNYWYSEEPISPAAAELRLGQAVDFEGAINWINSLRSAVFSHQEGLSGQVAVGSGQGGLQSAGGVRQAGVLLVEGVGGLLAPLAKGRTVASLGQALGAQLIVVAPNRVGVINQVLLTVEAAAKRGLGVACVVLMGQREADLSSLDNAALIRDFLPELAGFKGVFEFPWLGVGADNPGQIGVNVKKVEKVLAEIYEACRLRGPSGSGVTDQPSG